MQFGYHSRGFPELKKIAAENDNINEINHLIEESLKKKIKGSWRRF
jgi:hypothetical protein